MFDNLKVVEGTDRPKVGLSVYARYGQSKIGNVLFANELNKRYESQGLVASSCNPGNLNSDRECRLRSAQRRIVAMSWPLGTRLTESIAFRPVPCSPTTWIVK